MPKVTGLAGWTGELLAQLCSSLSEAASRRRHYCQTQWTEQTPSQAGSCAQDKEAASRVVDALLVEL